MKNNNEMYVLEYDILCIRSLKYLNKIDCKYLKVIPK